MDYIEMNFRQAKQQAARLENLASRLENLAKREMEETLQRLSGCWRGKGADAYMQKGHRLSEDILQTAGDLQRTAQTIRTTAKRTYDAEMRARELAEKRTYGEGGQR